jgi:hypothetical protein
MAGERHGHGMGTACYVLIDLKAMATLEPELTQYNSLEKNFRFVVPCIFKIDKMR